MKKSNKKKILIVLPAYNAERTLEKVYKNIPKKKVNEVLLVDDGSKDYTTELSKKLGIITLTHKHNMGYGANQKTCYTYALRNKFDFIIMLHPDGQYNPKDISKFISKLESGQADLILGSRFLDQGDKETPKYKAFSIKMITLLFNLFLGIKLTEANTGYRGLTRQLLESIPFNKNGTGYIFDPQLIIQTVHFGFKIDEVPVSKRYNQEAISPNFSKSLGHGLENLKLLVDFSLHRLKLKKIDFLISD